MLPSFVRDSLQMLSAITLEDASSAIADSICKLSRTNDGSISTPTQDPALDLDQAGKLHLQLDTAIFQRADLLGIVPLLFLNIIRHPWYELNHNLVLLVAGMDSEAAAQALFQRELLRSPKYFSGAAQGLNARR